MALNDTTISKSSFKLLQGKAHTNNSFDLANEGESSSPTLAAQEIFGDAIPVSPSDAITDGVAAFETLSLALDPNSAGKAYFAVIDVVAGSNLNGKVNPRTGSLYADGDRVGYLIPPKFDAPAETSPLVSYRAILRDSGTEVAPTDAKNWFFDYRSGIVTSETNLSLSSGTIDGYVYTGVFVSDQVSADGYFTAIIDGSPEQNIKNTNDGYVGIGSASSQFPNRKLHIADSSPGGVYTIIQNSDTTIGSSAGLLFKSGTTDDTTKSGLIFERTGGFGVGKLHLVANQTGAAGNVDITDAVISVDTDRNIGINKTEPTYALHIVKDGTANIIAAESYNNIGLGGALISRYARGSEEFPSSVEDGDQALGLQAYIYDAGTYRLGSSIDVYMDGVVGAGDIPTRMVFKTTADGTSSALEKVRITNQGYLGVNTTTSTAHRLHVKDSGLPAGRNIAKFESSYFETGTIEGVLVNMTYTAGDPSPVAAKINLSGHAGANSGKGLQVISDSSGSSLIDNLGSITGNVGIEISKTSPTSVSTDSTGLYSSTSGSRRNISVLGGSVSGTNSPSLNIGVWGGASGGASNIGVYATTGIDGTDQEVPSVSGALVANNESSTLPIILGMDSDTTVFLVEDGGDVVIGGSSSANNYRLDVRKDVNAISGASVLYNSLLARFQRTSDVSGGGAGIGFTHSTDVNTLGAAIVHERVGTQSQGKLHFATKQTTGAADNLPIRMTIDQNGFVGIGTMTPTDALTLSSLGQIGIRIDADTNDGGGEGQNPYLILTQDGRKTGVVLGMCPASNQGPFSETMTGAIANYPMLYGKAGDAVGAFGRGLQLGVGTSASGDGAILMTLTHDTSRVGIGTSSPDALLHLASSTSGGSTLRLGYTNTTVTTGEIVGGIEFATADADNPGLRSKIDARHVSSIGGTELRFFTSSGSDLSQYLTIGASGGVGVSHTAGVVVGAISGTSLLCGSPSGDRGRIDLKANTAPAAGSREQPLLFMEMYTGTDRYIWVDDTGDVRIHTTAVSEAGDKNGTVVGTQSFTGMHFYATDALVDSDSDDGTSAYLRVGDSVRLEGGKVIRSTMQMQKDVIGVFVGMSSTHKNSLSNEFSEPDLGIEFEFACVASVGDARDFTIGDRDLRGFSVCDEGGPILPGDLLCSSSKPGRLMKQSDDIVRSFTVGKALASASFDANGDASGLYGYILCG